MATGARTSLLYLALFVLLPCVSATILVVGGSGCHLIPSTINAYVGDTLEFTDNLAHDVLEVNQQEYATCSTVNSITVHNSSDTVVHLTQPGMRYFICGGHPDCAMGLKFCLNVLPQIAANVTRRGGGGGGSLPASPRRPPKSPSKRRSPPPPATPDNELPDTNIPETASSPTASVSSTVGGTITTRCFDFWWAILFTTPLVLMF